MNGITILIWITIAMIAVIAIILVKLHFKGDKLETEESSILPSSFGEVISFGNDIKIENRTSTKKSPRSLSPQSTQSNKPSFFKKEEKSSPENDDYIIPDVSTNNTVNYEYESQNQVLVNYDNKVEKFQEPIKQSQMDIMTQNNKDQDTTELKDLFTIDELIKESKRKDSEREKESQTIKKDEEDQELKEIKESIKNKTQEPLIEEIVNEKEETIGDLINDAESEEEEKTETPSITSQKDIDEAIDTASKETKEEVESISEKDEITDVLLNNEEKEESEEISEPALKTPKKVSKTTGEEKKEYAELDYRKDLDKFTNKIKSSKIFQDVKEKIIHEPEETPEEETFIRNVNEYDEFEPIINETHEDFEENYGSMYDERLRQENTRKIFEMNKVQETQEPSIGSIKEKPARDNIKIKLNNNEVVLKKGDEIIFNHQGETYSSQVYAINGDDISVKYRRKNIKIKPSDVKKIY